MSSLEARRAQGGGHAMVEGSSADLHWLVFRTAGIPGWTLYLHVSSGLNGNSPASKETISMSE